MAAQRHGYSHKYEYECLKGYFLQDEGVDGDGRDDGFDYVS